MIFAGSFAAADGAVPAAFVAGAWLGLSIAMPVGPTSLLCMSRTLLGGPAAGLVTGLAAATVHVALSIVSATAVMHVPPPTGVLAQGLGLLAALVLLGIAWRTLRSAPAGAAPVPHGLLRGFASALAYCASNPVTWLLIAAASPAALGANPTAIRGLAAGIFFGSFGWWCCLTASVAGFRRMLPPPVMPVLRLVSAVILVGFAMRMLQRLFA